MYPRYIRCIVAHIHTHAHAHAHAHTHARIHTHTQAHIHTHTHTYTQQAFVLSAGARNSPTVPLQRGKTPPRVSCCDTKQSDVESPVILWGCRVPLYCHRSQVYSSLER